MPTTSEKPSLPLAQEVIDAIADGHTSAPVIIAETGRSRRDVWRALYWLCDMGYIEVHARDYSTRMNLWRIVREPDLSGLSRHRVVGTVDRFSIAALADAWPLRVMLPPGRPRTPHHVNQD